MVHNVLLAILHSLRLVIVAAYGMSSSLMLLLHCTFQASSKKAFCAYSLVIEN